MSAPRGGNAVKAGMLPLPRVSGRVLLRRLRPTDTTAFLAYRSDPVVARYQGWSPRSGNEASEFIAEMACVARVIGVTDARNAASIKVLERVGMGRVESRETVFKAEPCIEWVYSRSRGG